MPDATPTLLYADFEGAVSLVESYLVDDYDEVRFLSVGGPAEAVKAVLAAAKLPGSRLTLFRPKAHGNLHQRGREYVGPLLATATPSRLLCKRLPCGQVHGVLYPDTTPSETPRGFTLVIPKAEEAGAPARLLRLIDVRTTLPLHPSWAGWVWHILEEHGGVTPLNGIGHWVGWEIHWNERQLIQELTEAVKACTLRIGREPQT
ncbi:MAG: hypothetical protein WC713_11810 [Candidatus Methylomirabilota bacterium]